MAVFFRGLSFHFSSIQRLTIRIQGEEESSIALDINFNNNNIHLQVPVGWLFGVSWMAFQCETSLRIAKCGLVSEPTTYITNIHDFSRENDYFRILEANQLRCSFSRHFGIRFMKLVSKYLRGCIDKYQSVIPFVDEIN